MYRKIKVLMLAIAVLGLASGCSRNTPVSVVSFPGFNDTVVSSLPGTSEIKAETIFSQIRKDIDYMQKSWDPSIPGPLARTNLLLSSMQEFSAPPSLIPLIRLSQQYSEMTGGLYDPAAARLTEYYTAAEPTIESAQELMQHKGVRLLAVTGGSGVVRQAMTSGKRAICAGPGNPPVVVDATADLALAGRCIVAGGSFDNNIVCTDEKEVIAVESIADELVRQMCRHGAYLLTDGELHRVEQAIFAEQRGPRRPAVIEKDLIGKNAREILQRAGITCHDDPPLLVARVANDHPLVWSEQMMPVMPVTTVPDVDTGIELAREAEHGFGHSAGMFSRNIDALSRMARTINKSIFTKNGLFYAGLGEGGEGHSSFTIASPTGEGLTGPVAFSRLRRCVLVDHFRIV